MTEVGNRLPVCVLIPAYNRADVLQACLRSVWAQQPRLPAQVLVVDDGSADATAEVAVACGAEVLRHESNRGLAAARNTGLAASRYRWVALLDTDDEWLPQHLAELWRLRGSHALVGTAALWRHSDRRDDRFHGPPGRRPVVLRTPDPLLQTDNIFCASGTMVDREVAQALGGFEAHHGVSEDFELWVRMLEHHTAICSERVTVVYNVHEGQMSSDWERMHMGHRAVALAHAARTGRSARPLERWEGVAAWDTMRRRQREGRPHEALRALRPIIAGRQELLGVAMVLWFRFRSRRRSSEVGPDGRASVAVLVNDPPAREKVLRAAVERETRDYSGLSRATAFMKMIRTPVGVAVTDSRPFAFCLRTARIRVARPEECGFGESA